MKSYHHTPFNPIAVNGGNQIVICLTLPPKKQATIPNNTNEEIDMPIEHKCLKDFYKGYQGACPKKAKFLFIGSDANFPADMSQKLLDDVKEYLEDGAKFWCKHGVHHPFLLHGCMKGGGKYHRWFEKIGFKACRHAQEVSFLELHDYPTIKSDGIQDKNLNAVHLEWLDAIISCDREKYVFITCEVFDAMKRWKKRKRQKGLFKWLPIKTIRNKQVAWLGKHEKTEIYKIYHFSRHMRDAGIAEIAKIVETR